jgi:two-component system NtrC family sensor kinase
MRKQITIARNIINFILLFTNFHAISQIRDTTAARKVLATIADDSLKMMAHQTLGRFFIDINNDSSLIHAQQAYLLARKIQSKKYEAQGLDFLGAVLSRRGNADQALGYLLKGRDLFASLNDSTYLIVANRNIAGVYKSQHDTSKAFQYYSNALNITLKSRYDSLFYSWALMDFGDLLLTMNKPKQALYYSKQSYNIGMNLSMPFAKKYLPIALNTIGRIYEKTGNYGEALEKYKQAVKVGLDNYNQEGAADNDMAIASLFTKTNNKDSGFYYAKKAFAIARHVNNPQAVEMSSNYLKNYYRDKNQLDSAFVYQEIMGNAKDSLLSLEKIREVQNLSFKEQTQQQELLATQQAYRNKIRTYLFGTGLVLLLLIAIILWRSNQQKQKDKIKIEQAYNELKATQAQLIQSEKMASLGELTAGIAHEIQNPLNFVNNFSEVNTEMIDEATEEIDKGNIAEVKNILNDIKENEEKINHHGKRADAIVKGMLQHSQSSKGVKEPTDIMLYVMNIYD